VRRLPASRVLARVIAITAILAVNLAAVPAGAAWPGANGNVAFSRGGAIISQAPDGTEVRLAGGGATAASWSPDGTKVTYLRYANVGPGWYDVFMMNADGSGKKNLTKDVSRYSNPSFSPDGTKVMFTEYDGNAMGNLRVHTIRTDGTGRKEFAPEVVGSMADGVWSPDGTRVAYVGGPTGSEPRLRVIRATGNPGTVVTLAAEFAAASPDWHPTVARLVFTRLWSYENNRRSIHRINLNGSGLRKLADYGDNKGADEAAFAPDGTRVVFDKSDYMSGSKPQIWSMSAVDGSSKVRIDINGYGPSWQPVP
jgi:Tol biopolymer transport system component